MAKNKLKFRDKIRNLIVLIFVIIFAWLGILMINNGSANVASETANLWIDGKLNGTCEFSASKIAYNEATACSSMVSALNSVGNGKGETSVKIIAGQYQGQTIPDDSRTASDRVTFSESNGEVEFDFLDIHGDNITLNGFKTLRPYWTATYDRGISIAGSSTQSIGVKLVNVIAQSGLYLTNTKGVRINGGEICCTLANDIRDAKVLYTNGNNVEDTVIDGVAIHDAHRSGPLIHSECGFLMSPSNLNIRNSHFYNCTVYNISLGRLNSDPDPLDIVFENNVLEPTDNLVPGDRGGYFNISLGHVSDRFENLTFRNNSIGSPIQFFDVTEPTTDTPTGAYELTSFYSNMLELTNGRCTTPSQPAGQPKYDYNIVDITSSNCGSNQKVVADTKALWANFTSHDFRLLSKNGAGSPSQSTSIDIVGTQRPQGSNPDAGAYEYTGTSTPSTKKQGDVNGDTLVNIDDLSILLSKWNTNYTPADFLKDNTIDISDLSILLGNWGK